MSAGLYIGFIIYMNEVYAMSTIQICVGSSCHLKGSYQVIQSYKRLIEKYGLQDKVELQASFCMQKCTGGIAAAFDGEPVENLSVRNCEAIFMEKIMR
jgi:NADH:ubiquinone oxidoreductase subunit E